MKGIKNIRNLDKTSFFEPGGYSIIQTSTGIIINTSLLILFLVNLYLQYKAMDLSLSWQSLMALLSTPWVIITLLLLFVYKFHVLNMVYFTIEGEKSFSEILDKFLFIINNRKKSYIQRGNYKKFILKRI